MVAADKNVKTKAAVPTITAHTSKLPAFEGAEGTRPRPMARRGSKAVRRAQDFGWKSPEAAAVLVASFVVSLACFYVAAYAKVASEGIESARIQFEIKEAAREKEALEAEISRITLPKAVQARAVQMDMVKTPPQTVRLVTPSPQNNP